MRPILLSAVFFGVALFVASTASAHRDGCHRLHWCPSDTGSYVCGDLGNTSGCGGAIQSAPVQSAPVQQVVLATRIPIRTTTPTNSPTPTDIPTQTLVPTSKPSKNLEGLSFQPF